MIIPFRGSFFAVFSFTLCLILSLSLAAPAEARTKKLTEKKVKEFVQKTAELSSGSDGEMDLEKTRKYLQKHIEDDARFKSTMKYALPGQPTQENSMSLSKEDFINGVSQGQDSVSDYDSAVEVISVDISSDGKNATAVTKSKEAAKMPISLDGGNTIQYVPIEGASTCNQIIRLSKKGVIRMFGAQCETNIEFLPE